ETPKNSVCGTATEDGSAATTSSAGIAKKLPRAVENRPGKRAMVNRTDVMRTQKTDVLVVGAGPTGLLTALLLSEAGVDVTVIDREERTAARSYACALHSSSLALLDRLGLAATVLEHGRRIDTIGFYDGELRRAEIQLPQLDGDFPFLLVLPQSL